MRPTTRLMTAPTAATPWLTESPAENERRQVSSRSPARSTATADTVSTLISTPMAA